MTQGSINALVHLGQFAVPVALELPDGTLQITLNTATYGVGLRQVVGWLLNTTNYRFPSIMGSDFLNQIQIRAIEIVVSPRVPKLAIGGRLDDITILGSLRLTQPELDAEFSSAGVKVCVQGIISNPPNGWLHGTRLHFCYPDWKPKDDAGDDPVNPDTPPGPGPGLNPGTLGALLGLLLTAGLTIGGALIAGLVAAGWTLPELAAGLLGIGATATEVAAATLETGASTAETLEALYQGLRAVEAIQAELEALEATIEASYQVEPLENLLGDVLLEVNSAA